MFAEDSNGIAHANLIAQTRNKYLFLEKKMNEEARLMPSSREPENVFDGSGVPNMQNINDVHEGDTVDSEGSITRKNGDFVPGDAFLRRWYDGLEEFVLGDHIEKGKHYSVVVVGSRNSGKSYLLGDWYKTFREKFDINVLYSMSLNAPVYKERVLTEKDDFKTAVEGFQPKIMQALEKLQKELRSPLDICQIFDDQVDFSRQKNSDELVQMFIRGRNFKSTIVFFTQSVIALTPSSRENIDYLVITRIRTPEMKENVIRKMLFHIVPTRSKTTNGKIAELSKWLNFMTVDNEYSKLVIDFLNHDKIYKISGNQK